MLIQKLRLQRGWSQEQLAELSGLSTRTIQRVERGQPASVETLKALGAVFDVDFSTLKEPDMSNAAEVPTATSPAPAEHIEEALAFAHVRAIKGFYVHASQYLVVMAFLVILNLVVTPHYFWAIFPMLGWGAGVAFHGLRAFDMIPLLTGDWEKREVEKRLGRKL